MAQSDNKAWQAVKQAAVQSILSNTQLSMSVQPVLELAMKSLLRRHGYDVSAGDATELGRGTYGCVMPVRRLCDGRLFAMKRQPFALTTTSAETVLREIAILNAAKGSTGLIQMEDVFMEAMPINSSENSVQPSKSAEVWAVLEHFPSNLSNVKISFRSESSTCNVIFQLLQGLQALHGADIVHRDLKPANVLVDPGSNPPLSARVVICDFGLSRSISAVDNEVLETADDPIPSPRRHRPVSTDVVTAPWRAPELWGWADVGRMSKRDMKSIDIFSLALIWAELLGGSRVIHSEDNRDPPALRLLEILRRVDCPEDSVLESLGFAQEVSQFVRSLASDDFIAVRAKIEGPDWPHDSLCHQGYGRYLLNDQPYRGIRAWVLEHAPTLPESSPALSLIESSSRFDYRRRSSADELLQDPYFSALQAEYAELSQCRSITDVGDALEVEGHLQAAAYKNGAEGEVWASVERIATSIQSEMALGQARAAEESALRQATNASSLVLLGRLPECNRQQESDRQRPCKNPFREVRPSRFHLNEGEVRPSRFQLNDGDLPMLRVRKFPTLRYLGCPGRRPPRGGA